MKLTEKASYLVHIPEKCFAEAVRYPDTWILGPVCLHNRATITIMDVRGYVIHAKIEMGSVWIMAVKEESFTQ